jgi:hypothetical protein
MSRPFLADKENLRERTIGLRTAIGDGSYKTLGLGSKKELPVTSDKSARLLSKKDPIKLTPTAVQHPLTNSHTANNAKKVLSNTTKTEDIVKESSLPQRKYAAPPMAKPSLISNYLSRDRELRVSSKSKTKKDDENDKKNQNEALHPTKSILQLGHLNPKIQSLLNPIKKSVKRTTKEPNEQSSTSNLSEISDLPRNGRPHDFLKDTEVQNLKSTDKITSSLMPKDKKAFFSKKQDSKPQAPLKKNFTSLNKSRISGSSCSIDLTPDKTDKHTVVTVEKPKPLLGGCLATHLAAKAKENLGNIQNNPKLSRIKKEKLVCLENLIVKNENSLQVKNTERDFTSGSESNFHSKATQKKKEVNIEDEIRNFVQENQNAVYSAETLGFMIQSEAEYMPDPHYLDKNQNEIKWKMRAMLLDWLIEVCNEYTLKISTFHYAVNYVDRYLSIVTNVQKSNFQLIGLTALSIATKIEEIVVPQLSDFAVSASNIFSVETIKKMELSMLKVQCVYKTLKWRTTPPTLHLWANWYTCQWDYFIENCPECKMHPLVVHNSEQKVMFRQLKKDSYYR